MKVVRKVSVCILVLAVVMQPAAATTTPYTAQIADDTNDQAPLETPSTGGESLTSPTKASTGSHQTSPAEGNATALEYRRAALRILRNASLKNANGNGKGNSGTQQARYLTRLEGTLEHSIDSNRIDSVTVFQNDRRVAAPLSNQLPEVSALLVKSDRALARTAVEDAYHVAGVLRDRGVDFDEPLVRKELAAAERDIARGKKLQSRSANAGAIKAYQSAWEHAQTALDEMDQAVDPAVSIVNRSDPMQDGPVEYQVSGVVFDVRAHELTLTLVQNGGEQTIDLATSTAPGTVATFNATITLDQQVNSVTVTAGDPNTRWAPVKGKTKTPETTYGSDILELDGDALSDHYETDITKTATLDPDSDSSITSLNEANDGIIDGIEDFDADGLETRTEAAIGTDPFDSDTDDDQLTDWFEHTFDTIDPVTRDSDQDGVPDWREDPDSDKLQNIGEQRHETDPLDPDTDNDSLTDAYEVRTTYTVPTVRDSDTNQTAVDESGNGISDGAEDFDEEGLQTALEAAIGTNPFDPDTDGDQLTDQFEHSYDTIDPLTADTDSDGVDDGREDPDTDTLRNLGEQTHGTDPLDPDTDDDTLTDAEEVNETATVPVIPDSDSERTPPDESSNGIIDGAEDFDDDGLETSTEFTIRTDPFDADTDKDGLTDGFEHRYDTIDPLAADTDGDGTDDGQEDPDTDTLRNLGEQRHGTHPLDPDTDDDKLTDAAEVRVTETDPVIPDSDTVRTAVDEAGNGIIDGVEDFDDDNLSTTVEMAISSDPFVADTDGDGLRDGFEYYWSNTSATDADFDGDGILDSNEDHDADGLTTGSEQNIGTDPRDADTDDDQLLDGFEVNNASTSPLAIDSDASGTDTNESHDGVHDAAENLDEDTLDNFAEQQNGTNALAGDTDSDGLLDGYELETSLTSPRQKNSDSALTVFDESTNDVYDGAEDLDGDGLRLRFEMHFGTDITSTDTDGDGLPDRYDALSGTYNATNPDSDGDGVPDGKEDPDGDRVPNEHELDVGTNPNAADTDRDGLPDGLELGKARSDPTDPMTDSDELTDGEEFDLGTNPTDPDTDGDGVLDHDETFTTQTKEEDSDAVVEATGAGSSVSKVSVENSTNTSSSDTRASHVLGVSGVSEETKAKVTIPYTSGIQTAATGDSKIDDPTVYVWNPTTATGWEAVPTTVNDDGTVTAEVDQNGYVVVRDKDDWQAKLHSSVQAEGVLVIEGDSGGIQSQDWETCPPYETCNGGTTTTTTTSDSDPTTTTTSDSDPTTTTTTTSEPERPQKTVTLPTQPENIYLFMKPASSRRGAVISVTGPDGDTTYASGDGRIRRTLNHYKGETITITYEESLIGYVFIANDTDGDTIVDPVEKAAATLHPNRSFDQPLLGIDYTEADTDGDRLPDNEEISLYWTYNAGRVHVDERSLNSWNSHPARANTDGAGLNDYEETQRGSNPWSVEVLQGGYNVPVMGLDTENRPMLTQDTGNANADVVDKFILVHSTQYLPTRDGACDCRWMSGIEVDADKTYIRFPITIYMLTNWHAEKPDSIHYSISISETNARGSQIVKLSKPLDGVIEADESYDRGYVVVELSMTKRARDYSAIFNTLGKVTVEFTGVDEGSYERNGEPSLSQQYAVDGAYVGHMGEEFLEGVNTGTNLQLAIEKTVKKAYSLQYEGKHGTVKGRVSIWRGNHDTLADKIILPPTSVADIIQEIINQGFGYFIDKAEAVQREGYPEGAVIRIGGGTFIRVS